MYSISEWDRHMHRVVTDTGTGTHQARPGQGRLCMAEWVWL